MGRAAHAAHCAGEPHRATALGRRALELADRTGHAVSSAVARERLGIYLWAGGDSDAALAAYREAERFLPPEPPTPELARVLAAEAEILVLRGPGEEARACSERAVATARAAGARTVEAHALDTLGSAMSVMGDWVGGERALREAIRISEELSDDYGRTRAYISLGDCLDQQGRLEEAAELALERARVAEHVGVRTHALFLTGDACWRLICLGRLDQAQAIADEALTAAPKGMPGVLLLDAAAHLALRRGRLEAAEEHFRGTRELLSANSDSMWIGNTASGQAEVALWRSDPDGAWTIAARALDIVAGREYVHYTARLYATALRSAADRALRALALGDERGAAEAQGDAHVILERLGTLAGCGPLAARHGGPRAGRLRSGVRRRASRAGGHPDAEAWAARPTASWPWGCHTSWDTPAGARPRR